MAKLLCKKRGELADVRKLFLDHLSALGSSAELAGCYSFEDHWFGVIEKYYMRAGSYASLSIHLYQHNDEVYLEAIGAGGGAGMFNISWGSEGSFIKKLESLLKTQHFVFLDCET